MEDFNKDHYDNGRKQTWRGWVWNRICDRIPKCYRRESVAAYLPGPKDRDRAAALTKGFANHNLIAIDVDQSAVDSVRRNGGVAICGEMTMVLEQWPHNLRIDVVIADLLCGVTRESQTLMETISRCGHGGTVCVMNLMRGRDPAGGELRSAIDTEDVESLWKQPEYFDTSSLNGPLDGRHRGYAMMSWLFFQELHIWELIGATEKAKRHFMHQFMEHCNPALYSYRSERGMIFDTVVFNCPNNRTNRRNLTKKQRAFWSEVERLDRQARPNLYRKADKTAQKTAAMSAVRTCKAKRSRKGIIASDRPGAYDEHSEVPRA